ncbi:MAG: DUF1080 domain-containing protein, partial [Chitinophagaceae bacterium]|nr:DUF1080 domain-containing protein [Chitinophagaceae bacterium]
MITAIQKTIATCVMLVGLSACAQKNNAGWISLFNGKDLKDWDIKIARHELNDNYGNTFRVEDGLLKVRYDQYKSFDSLFGHIFYKKPFSAYLLVAEYRFVGEQVPGGPGWAVRNNGLMLHSQSAASMKLNQDFPISLETQLLGGIGKDARPTANLCTPGTNVVMDGKLITDHCISSSSKTYSGDQWVHVETLVLADSIVYNIVEGDTVLVYTKPQIGGEFVANYDPSIKQDGKLLKEGYISLQAESAPIDFRKVELFDLSPYMNDPAALRKILAELRKRKT